MLYKMTEEDLQDLKEASKSVPMIALQCGTPTLPREKAHAFWKALGKKLGFDWETARPALPEEGERCFNAEEI